MGKGKKMAKYIHYKKLHETGILISDNPTEQGYSLGLEIDCKCFNKVLSKMQIIKGVPLDIVGNVITNENLSGFKSEFMSCMDRLAEFSRENYCLRELHSDCAAWYERKIHFRL